MKNPWLGLESYNEDSLKDYQFNGRTLASASVASLIRHNLFVTLYGRSGIGKTSLLQAGVFPILRREGFYPVTIRLNNITDSKASSSELNDEKPEKKGVAVKVIWDKISAALQKHGFVYSPCDKKDEYEPDFSDVLVLRMLFSSGRFLNDKGEEGIPVILLDQFEEILYKAPQSATFLISQLYALIDDNYNWATSHPSWHDDTTFRIVVSIREDDLYLFEDYIDLLNCIDFKSNRYRLLPLSENEAKEVILRPIEGMNIFEEGKEEEIAEEIIKLTKNNEEKVNTLLLSLLCYVLFNNIVKQGNCVSLSSLKNYKDVLETFYLEIVKDLPKDERYYIEDHLIDDQGRRTSLYITDIKKFAPNALPLIKNSKGSENSKEKTSSDETPESNTSRILFNESQGRVELIHDQLAASMYVFRSKRIDDRRSRFVAVSLVSYFTLASYLIWCILSNVLNLGWNIGSNHLLLAQIHNTMGETNMTIEYIQCLLGSRVFTYFVVIYLLGFAVPKMICQYFYGSINLKKLIVLALGLIISYLMASEQMFEICLSTDSFNYIIIGYIMLIVLLIFSLLFNKKQNNHETE